MSFKPRNFREWCNHTIPVLPQVYGDELSYYELLNKVIEKLNEMGITVNELIDYVNNYFDSIDVQKMIDDKLDEMAQDGTLADLINNLLFSSLNKKIETVINVKENGCDNTGLTDCSATLNTLIDSNSPATFYFPKGNYLVNGTILLNKSCKILFESGALISVTENVDTLFNVCETYSNYSSVFEYPTLILDNINVKASGNVKTVIKMGFTYNSSIVNAKIKGFTDTAVLIENGGRCNISNSLFWGINNNSKCGYMCTGYDNVLDHVTIVNCTIGFVSQNDNLIGCTAWIDEHGLYKNSIAFYNGSYSSYSECISDTMSIGWQGKENTNTFLSNCRMINNDAVATTTDDTLVFSCEQNSCKFYFINLTIILKKFTLTKIDLGYISGINLVDSFNTGKNKPLLTSFNQLVLPTEASANISSSFCDSIKTDSCLVGFFEKYSIADNYGNCIGKLITTKTDSFLSQTVFLDGYFPMTRTFSNNTWSNWVSNLLYATEEETNISKSKVDGYGDGKFIIGYFEANAAGNETANFGCLISIRSGQYWCQISAIANNTVKTRMYYNQAWTDWK
nr:MAG TPA: Pectate lyase [Bacteriophage sp.]